MTNAEAVEWLKYNRDELLRYADTTDVLGGVYESDLKPTIEALDMAIAALEKQEGKKPITVETNIYDTEEIHHGCIVQILRNSVTGETSVGWWKEKEG